MGGTTLVLVPLLSRAATGPASQTAGYGSAGWASGLTFKSIEGVVGSAYADSLSAGDGDQTFVGGAGNEYLAGGAGADTYVFNRGDGYDVIGEDNGGWNVLSFGEGIKFSDLWIETLGSPVWLTVGIRGTADSVRTTSNFAVFGNNKLKSIDMNGAGSSAGGPSGAGSLAALLAAMDQGPGGPAPGLGSASDDPALTQQQMLLRQAMAGFGGQAGGSAAVWNRDMAPASAVLAASGQTRPSSAFTPALAS